MKMYILILLRKALKKRNKFVKNYLSIEYSLSKHTIPPPPHIFPGELSYNVGKECRLTE